MRLEELLDYLPTKHKKTAKLAIESARKRWSQRFYEALCRDEGICPRCGRQNEHWIGHYPGHHSDPFPVCQHCGGTVSQTLKLPHEAYAFILGAERSEVDAERTERLRVIRFSEEAGVPPQTGFLLLGPHTSEYTRDDWPHARL